MACERGNLDIVKQLEIYAKVRERERERNSTNVDLQVDVTSAPLTHTDPKVKERQVL